MIIYGASGHGKVIMEILEICGINDIEFWDDQPSQILWDKKISRPLLINDNTNDRMIVAIGDNRVRKYIVEKVNKGFSFINAIHPNASISPVE